MKERYLSCRIHNYLYFVYIYIYIYCETLKIIFSDTNINTNEGNKLLF